MSIARRVFPSRLELKRRAGSFRDAPLAKVSFTTFLYDSPVQTMPPCDQIGVPIHFHSSTTSGSASLMSLRILLRVSPRQSASSAILFEMSSDADWPWLAPDFFMFSSSKFQIYFICKTKALVFRRLALCLISELDRFAVAILGTRPGRKMPAIGEPKSDPLPGGHGCQLCFDGLRDHEPILSRDGFLLAPNFCYQMI